VAANSPTQILTPQNAHACLHAPRGRAVLVATRTSVGGGGCYHGHGAARRHCGGGYRDCPPSGNLHVCMCKYAQGNRHGSTVPFLGTTSLVPGADFVSRPGRLRAVALIRTSPLSGTAATAAGSLTRSRLAGSDQTATPGLLNGRSGSTAAGPSWVRPSQGPGRCTCSHDGQGQTPSGWRTGWGPVSHHRPCCSRGLGTAREQTAECSHCGASVPFHGRVSTWNAILFSLLGGLREGRWAIGATRGLKSTCTANTRSIGQTAVPASELSLSRT
jgi:hypothetical protein